MKKILTNFLILSFALFFVGISFSEEELITKTEKDIRFLKSKTASIRADLASLKGKLKKIKHRRKKKALLSLIAKQQQRVKKINKEIAEKERKLSELMAVPEIKETTETEIIKTEEQIVTVEAQVNLPPPPPTKKGILLGGGLMGGAGVLNLGYAIPLQPNLEVNIEGGYGAGSGFTLLVLRGLGKFKINPEYFIGLSVDYGNYSVRVENVPGLSGRLPAGGSSGIGISAGKTFGDWIVQLGYSSVLGFILVDTIIF